MILVDDVHVIEHRGMHAQIGHYPEPKIETLYDRPLEDYFRKEAGEVEDVHAREYHLPDGRIVHIGWSKKVHEALRIPLDCVEDQARTIEQLHRENVSLSKGKLRAESELEAVMGWDFWRRLKFFVLGR